MQTFKTLLLREWMQHGRGWLILTLAPLAVLLLALVFGQVQMGPSDHAAGVLLMAAFGYTLLLVLLAGLAVMFQSPGLARRDRQDRSIEFWLSLPTGHWVSIAAVVLAHFWLLPLMALALGLGGALLIAPLVVVRGFGVDALLHLPWSELLPALLAGSLRLAVGLVLAMAWFAPLLLLAMAASAWLKRWGVPVVAAVLGIGALLLDRLYGLPQLQQAIAGLAENGMAALIPGLGDGPMVFDGDSLMAGPFDALPGWLMHDLGRAIQELASPAFAGALVVSGLCCWLLVLRRERGA